jgi:FMN phosphatase YigB (HAD superfamily)
VLHQLKERGTFERARLALRADRQERALLTQDAHPQVLKLLLKNPRLGLDEVQSMMRNKHLTGEIIQMILKDRRFQGSEDLKMLVIRHPRTPTPLAIQLLRQLRQENLRILAKSNNLREAIRRQARSLVQSKS